MAAEIELWNDIVNNRLVQGLNNQAAFLVPTVFQGSQLDLKIYPVKPTGSAVAPFFTKVSIAALLPFLYVGPRAGATSLLASQTTWTSTVEDTTLGTGYFRATLDLNTTNLNTAIGTNDSITSYIELQWSESGVRRVSYQSQLVVTSTVWDVSGASALPNPASSYYTKDEMDSIFVKWNNDNANSRGKSILLRSVGNLFSRILAVRDDGSGQDDII